MNLRVVLAAVGAIVLLCVGLMLVPLCLALVDGEPSATCWGWAISAAGGLVLGAAAWRFGRIRDERDLGAREGYAIVTFGWLSCSLLGAVPFVLGAHLGFLDAWFETISGFTTTGASVVPIPEHLPRSLLLWRALTQWVGGLGIVVLSVAVLPALGVRGASLVRAEFSEAQRRLQPRMASMARRLWVIYALLTLAQIALMALGGVGLFDGVCHAFATLSGGGFSTYSASVAAFGSGYVEWVVTAFMLIGGINFALMYGAFARGRFGELWRDPELRLYLGVFAAATLVVVAGLAWHGDGGTGLTSPVRAAAFNTASMITTTGFATADFGVWPGLCHLALVVVMFIGGCAGSTSGSIKSIRVAIAGKLAWRETRMLVRPRQVLPVRVGENVVDRDAQAAAMGFIVSYLTCFAVGAAIVAATGPDMVTAFTASAACIGNIGPGLGLVGPAGNYAHLAPAAKIALGACMLVGRLEIYSVIVLFAPRIWR